jgi:DNA polymerase-3 subunit alpha
MAFTDINNTSACLDFIRLGPKYGLRAVPGIDFRNSAEQCYVGIARNNEGFFELNRHLSEHLHDNSNFLINAPLLLNCYVIYPFSHFDKKDKDPASLRENEYIGIKPNDINRLRFSSLLRNKEKLVALHTCSFRNKREFNAHRLLRSIQNNCLLSKLSVEEQGDAQEMYRTPSEISDIYSEFHFLLENAQKLLENCTFKFTFGTDQKHKNQHAYTESEEEDFSLINRLCNEGLNYRYPNADNAVHQRISMELDIIRQKGFLSYFLINWDITSYARSKGFFYVGRGSGANSIVAYILRITDVDPIELDLYFERFINLYRKNPPDFDIDFSWTDREDITSYIFNRFKNVTLLAAYSTFQFKAVVRELGKVFGLPKHEIDALSEGKKDLRNLDEMSSLVMRYSALIQDFPNLLTIHAAGILITEKHIHHYTATFLPPKGFPTTHFDMVVAEDAGLYKFDILSQRGLAKIKESLELIRKNRPLAPFIDIHNIKRFKEDEKVKDLLRNAKAIGCFYVESPAMRMLLRKLQVDDYLGLVAASSVIRPGVARSGMMREYILRFRNPERRKDAHPVLLDLMPETYGVMVYQEDVIKVAHYFAGLDLSEADSLRRGMSGKFRSREEFQQAKEAFFMKAESKNRPAALVAEVWRQVESFAGYAFAKGHSASYAVESYQSLFLKAYYPLEYLCATINNFGGFYRTELYVHEARMHGAEIEAPCINRGRADSVIEGNTIILGFGLVKDLDHRSMEAILSARLEKGVFLNLNDFTKRCVIGLEQTSILIRIGAFRFTGKDKKELLWEAHFLLGQDRKKIPEKRLFDPPERSHQLPALFTAQHEEAFDQMELLGFPLCDPFVLAKTLPPNTIMSRDLELHNGKMVSVCAYLITAKLTSTADGKRMYFGTFTDREGNWIDTVHFPPIALQFPFRGRGIYLIKGKVIIEFDCANIEVSFMEKLAVIEDPRFAESRTMEKIRAQKKA